MITQQVAFGFLHVPKILWTEPKFSTTNIPT